MNAVSLIIPALTAGGTAAWGTFHPRSQLFGRIIKDAGAKCALTFDDGPNPRVTPRVLALLEKHRVSATFFVLGKYAAAEPGLMGEIAGANHTIGNHTFSHPSLVFFSRQRIIDELNRCNDVVFSATGRHTQCVRPPFGFRGPQFFRAAKAAGFSQIVMWTVNGRDWKPQAESNMRQRLQKVSKGDIVLLHDGDHLTSNVGRSHMLQALEYWLPRWQDAGLEFTSQVADTQRVKMA